MKLLTKNTDYAVRALLVLAEHEGSYVSARDIAREQNMPYQYTRLILRELLERGIIRSKEGGLGGFQLKVSPKKISLKDIMMIFQGRVQISECMFRKQFCANRPTCVLRRHIVRIEKKVAEEVEDITIKKLLSEMKGAC